MNKDTYLYGDLSQISSSDLKRTMLAYGRVSFRQDLSCYLKEQAVEISSRIEAELLQRRDLRINEKEVLLFLEILNQEE